MDDEKTTLADTLRAKSGVIIGVVGLIAWCLMLWAMFGDVL
jgi:hypothetical protein